MADVNFAIITGLSGAGKTVALHAMEDLGYFCIDNLPPALIPRFAQLLSAPEHRIEEVALVIDVRGGGFFEQAAEAVMEIEKSGSRTMVLFLDAADEVLITRFKETRRRHPLAPQGGIDEALQTERRFLRPLRTLADYRIDTSELGPADLRRRVFQLFEEQKETRRTLVSVTSFGFKHGTPRSCDLMFDVRFLPNPHYVHELRPRTGFAEEVSDFVWKEPVTQEFFRRLTDFLSFLLPQYQTEGKAQLSIAVGCTGGRHRSVVISRKLGMYLRQEGYPVVVEHRDLEDDDEDVEGVS